MTYRMCSHTSALATTDLGNLLSPNFPYEYDSNQDCNFSIQSDTYIKLEIASFQIENRVDIVSIYNGDSLMVQLDGHQGTKAFYSSGPMMNITFISDSYDANLGFGFYFAFSQSGMKTAKSIGLKLHCLFKHSY